MAATGDDTQRRVAEDLADVLSIRAAGPLEGPVQGWPPDPLRGTVEVRIDELGITFPPEE